MVLRTNPKLRKTNRGSRVTTYVERVQRFEEYYTNDPIRAVQDLGMLYSCLMASLSKVGKTKIMVWEKQ